MVVKTGRKNPEPLAIFVGILFFAFIAMFILFMYAVIENTAYLYSNADSYRNKIEHMHRCYQNLNAHPAEYSSSYKVYITENNSMTA